MPVSIRLPSKSHSRNYSIITRLSDEPGATAGLRPGEMLALRWSNVDLEAGAMRINRALSGSEFTATKTSRSRRKVESFNTARAALRALRKRQLEEQMKKAGLWKDHGLVFPSTVGTPLSHRNVVRSFKALVIPFRAIDVITLPPPRPTTNNP